MAKALPLTGEDKPLERELRCIVVRDVNAAGEVPGMKLTKNQEIIEYQKRRREAKRIYTVEELNGTPDVVAVFSAESARDEYFDARKRKQEKWSKYTRPKLVKGEYPIDCERASDLDD